MKFVRILVFAVLLTSTVLLAACNTVKGLGKDVEKGGEKVQGVAEGAKPK